MSLPGRKRQFAGTVRECILVVAWIGQGMTGCGRLRQLVSSKLWSAIRPRASDLGPDRDLCGAVDRLQHTAAIPRYGDRDAISLCANVMANGSGRPFAAQRVIGANDSSSAEAEEVTPPKRGEDYVELRR